MHRCDTLLSSTKNAPDTLYRPGQAAVHTNRPQRPIFSGRPYPQCLRFSPQVVSSTCGIDMRPPLQVKRHEAQTGLRTFHMVLYCLRLLLIHPSPRNLSAVQQANLQWSAPHCPAHVRQRRGTAPAQEYCSVSTPPMTRSQYANASPRSPPPHSAFRVGHNSLPPLCFTLPTKNSLLLAQKPFSIFGGGTANAAPSIRVGSFSGRSLDCPEPAKNFCDDENRRF
ncbi:hypothetical protein JAB5_45350 [Janthinobacterium sp. HH103]|nr:hypothetical protein JAB2_18260 [Janthinobacterium sp. HH100]OEZ69302.1 hypothetical protein JAB5_45350 [Janthinobacterium sp. HH103]QOU71150.1 hypothetical protein JAB4_005460 [Janthinobacterium sp. HH102]